MQYSDERELPVEYHKHFLFMRSCEHSIIKQNGVFCTYL